MKKLPVAVLAPLLAVCLVAGCAGETKSYTDPSKTIAASAGEEFSLALDSNPTTGYTWQEAHDAALLSLVEDRYQADQKAPGLVGAGGTQYFRFKALKQGKTQITLTYKRPWETDKADQKVFNIDIR